MDPRDIYRQVYESGEPLHPKHGRLQRYGAQESRDDHFVAAIKSRLNPPALLLDASCGRGHLLVRLRDEGYLVEATEICLACIEEFQEIQASIHNAIYQELATVCDLEAESFDGVISNDVLEHIPLADLDVAIANLCRLTKSYLFVSVGTVPAKKFPQALPELGIDDLHCIVKPPEWWERRLSRFMVIDSFEIFRRTYFAHGRKIE